MGKCGLFARLINGGVYNREYVLNDDNYIYKTIVIKIQIHK